MLLAIFDVFRAILGEFQSTILKLLKAETASNLEIVFFPAGEKEARNRREIVNLKKRN